MAKEIYLYSGIYSSTAESIVSQLEEYMNQLVSLRLNTPGGSVSAGWGMVAKMKEHGNVTIQVDGQAASMGAYLLPYAKKVIALDVSRIMIHKASGYVENDEGQRLLDGMNADLKAALSKKINVAKLKEITGYTLDDVFDSATPIDVWLTGPQAKEVGLVDEIVKMNPEEATAFDNMMSRIAAETSVSPTKIQTPNTTMSIDEIRAKHPELYAQIVATGRDQERDRVGAWLAFVDVDAVAVKKGVEDGKAISQTAMADLMRKSFSKETIASAESDAAKAVATTTEEPVVKTEAQAKISEFEAAAKKNLELIK
jgi:ATP-dependent Clp protease protease subunit